MLRYTTIGTAVSIRKISGAGGIAAMVCELLAAEALSLGETALSEGIAAVHLVTAAEFERLVADGEIIDAFTIGCFFHARLDGFV